MSASEYLAFLPLLIYGIALADLFRQWNRFMDLKQIFIPYLLLTVILTETALFNVFLFADLLDSLEGLSYSDYLSYLAPPFLFLLTVIFFTPDEGDETKAYFMKNMPVFLSLFALFTASHFLFDFSETKSMLALRILGILIILLTGLMRKKWMVYLIGVLWILSLIMKSTVVTT